MTITITGYNFDGPYNSTTHLRDQSGVYAILTPNSAGNYSLLDVGESATVKTRVDYHDRQPCWNRNAYRGTVNYAVHYVSGEFQRKSVEATIRKAHNPTCGER